MFCWVQHYRYATIARSSLAVRFGAVMAWNLNQDRLQLERRRTTSRLRSRSSGSELMSGFLYNAALRFAPIEHR